MAVFAGVALSFIASAGYSQYVQSSINRAALDIAGTATPSIEHLTKARAELRNVQILAHQYLATGGETRQIEAMAQAHDRFRAEIAQYSALRASPDAGDIPSSIARDVDEVDATVDDLVMSAARHDVPAVATLDERVLPDEVDKTSMDIARAVEFNAARSRKLAESIEKVRRRALIVEGAFDAVGFVLAMLIAFLLLRVVRHYTTLLESQSRVQERRADELEQFAGRVAHDILSPLASTGIALALADKGLPPEAGARSAIQRGQRSLERVKRTVDGLLEFARAGAQPLPNAHADVGAVAADMIPEIAAAAQERGIVVTSEILSVRWAACSAGVLTSLLANLLENAIKYMGDAPERLVQVRVFDRGALIRVEVVDTGPGIPEALQASIFKPYVRAGNLSKPGIGLGLATVERLVATHEGAVGVRSSPGQGSVFWFELPAAAGS